MTPTRPRFPASYTVRWGGDTTYCCFYHKIMREPLPASANVETKEYHGPKECIACVNGWEKL